jgi:hypothetical protein
MVVESLGDVAASANRLKDVGGGLSTPREPSKSETAHKGEPLARADGCASAGVVS